MNVGRILVPLCGKSLDLWFLAESGFSPLGVEFVPRAVEEFFAERGIEPVQHGPYWSGAGVQVFVGDFFELIAEPFDAVWDRAAMIALPADLRPRYAKTVLSLMRSGATLLLDTLDYDQARSEGPPFAVSDREVESYYADQGTLARLYHGDTEVAPQMKERGVTATTSLFLFHKS